MKRRYILLAVVLVVGALSMVPAAAGKAKVDLCHLRANDSFVAITVSERAVAAHVEHGDLLIGDAVPGMPGFALGDDCRPVATPVEVDDADDDGVIDSIDNCPLTANPDQADLDGDGAGDVCDSDIDGDGVDNTDDAFPYDPTETADGDGDGIGDNGDNCPDTFNSGQEDADGDGVGDACEAAPILVRAWGIDASGTEVLIARLLDSDGDGTASVGDMVETGVFPTSFDGSAFGAFPAAGFEVTGVPIWGCPSGAPQAQVTVAGGYFDWFGWPATRAEGFVARWTDGSSVHEVSLHDYFTGWDTNFEDWWFVSTDGSIQRDRDWSPRDDTFFDIEFDAAVCP